MADRRTAWLAAPAALLLLLPGCGGAPDQPPSALREAEADCAALPDFVPVAPGARDLRCTAARQQGHDSGTLRYASDQRPARLLAWSRTHANASGLAPRIATRDSYSAGEAARRSIRISVAPEGSGARVTVNWSRGI